MPAAGPQNTRRKQRKASKRRSPTSVAVNDTKGAGEFNKAKKFKQTPAFRKAMQKAYDAPRKTKQPTQTQSVVHAHLPYDVPTGGDEDYQKRRDEEARDRKRKVDALRKKVSAGGRLSYAERGILKTHSRRAHKLHQILRGKAQRDVDYDGLESGGGIDQFKDPKNNPAYELIQNFAQQQRYRKAKAAGDEGEVDRLFGTPEKDAKKKSNIEKFDRAEAAGLLAGAPEKAYGGLLKKTFSGADFLLEQAARPSHLVTGTAKGLAEGKDPFSAVAEGGKNFVTGETGGSDAVRAAGVKNKTLAGILGFGAEVATDPLNFVTFGTATPARAAAKEAFEQALKNGLTHHEALELAKGVFDAAPAHGTGASAGLRARVPFTNIGGEVRTSGKTTARIKEGLGRLNRPVTHKGEEPRAFHGLMQKAKTELNRNASHEGIHPVAEEYIRKGVQEGRGHRAKLETWAVNRVHAYKAHIRESEITPEQQTEMVHAIEANDLGRLKDPEVRKLAEAINKDLSQVGDEATQLGILDALVGERPAPHVPEVEADLEGARKARNQARRDRGAAERDWNSLLRGEGVSQGRAEVLSRNVGGRKSEVAAERAGRQRGSRDGASESREIKSAPAPGVRTAVYGRKKDGTRSVYFFEGEPRDAAFHGDFFKREGITLEGAARVEGGNVRVVQSPRDEYGDLVPESNFAATVRDAAKHEGHITQDQADLAERFDVDLHGTKATYKQVEHWKDSKGGGDSSELAIPTLDRPSHYMVALHELAHHVLKHKPLRRRVGREWVAELPVEKEVEAWRWALDRAKRNGMPVDDETRAVVAKSLSSYGESGSVKDLIATVADTSAKAKYAGGGRGVEDARTALAEGGRHLEGTRLAEKEAESHLAKTMRVHKEQTATRKGAEADLEAHAKEAKGYYPRTARDPKRTTDNNGPGRKSAGMTVTGNASRKVHERIETLPPDKQDFYLTDDAPTAVGQRLIKHANQVGQATMLNKLADLATPLHHADDLGHIASDEWDRVMVKSPKGFTPLLKTKGFQPDPAEAHAAVAKALEDGQQVVVVPEKEFALAHEMMTRGELSRTAAGTTFDRIHGGVKGGLTLPNPGFHLTNALGDTWNARLGGARFHSLHRGVQLATKERNAERAARDLGLDEKTSKLAGKVARGGKTEKYGDTELSDAELVDLAGQHGVLQRGLSQEIYGLKGGVEREMKGGEWKSGPLAGRRRPMEALRHLSEAREDIGRLWSFHDAMKRGLSPEDAATHVNKHHFDYTDFTETERAALKRFIPFYMFWSRNTPLQAGGLLARPGQFANMELGREESFRQAGLDPDDKKKMQRYEQQGLPFALPFKVDGNPVMLYPKLPATDLNLFPSSLGLKEGVQNLGEQTLQRFTPVIKTPLELMTGYDFFFKQEADKLSAAPGRLFGNPTSYADAKAINKQAGFHLITMEIDAKSGKLIPKWPRWMDKTARFLPWTNFGTSLATDKTPNQKDTKTWMSAISQFTGTRPAMVDWTDEKTSQLFDKLQKEEDARDALGKQVHRGSDEEWSDVADRPGEEGRIARKRNAHADKAKKLQAEIAKLQAGAGWKNPYFRDMLPKKKSPLEEIQAKVKATRNNAMGGKNGKKPAWLKQLDKLKDG